MITRDKKKKWRKFRNWKLRTRKLKKWERRKYRKWKVRAEN